MSDTQARRLAAMLTEKWKQEFLQVAQIISGVESLHSEREK